MHPSFQMSFAATLALVAGYQHGLPWMSGGGRTRLAAKIALGPGRPLLAGLAVLGLFGAAYLALTLALRVPQARRLLSLVPSRH